MDKTILNAVEKNVRELFADNDSGDMYFHNLQHTERVVEAASNILTECGLSESEENIVLVAAWFHDTGYFYDKQQHEEKSQEVARNFLTEKGIEENEIRQVESCIEVTKRRKNPENKLEKAISDADMSHLAAEDFITQTNLLREEWKKESDQKIKKKGHLFNTLQFILQQNYYTKYGKEVLEPKKQENIKKLEKEIENQIKEKATKDNNKGTNKKSKSAGGDPRGTQTMFRLTARNQINLSAIADNKSNILISVNAIILSVGATYLISKFSAMPFLIIPTFILLLTSLLTIITSIIATRPNVAPGMFTKDDIENERTNLLFFGNFYNMDFSDYKWGVYQLIDNSQYLYDNIIRDQYELGVVLARKYKMLRISYNIFMYGLIITFIGFTVAAIFVR